LYWGASSHWFPASICEMTINRATNLTPTAEIVHVYCDTLTGTLTHQPLLKPKPCGQTSSRCQRAAERRSGRHSRNGTVACRRQNRDVSLWLAGNFSTTLIFKVPSQKNIGVAGMFIYL
jgi:hypothetical protein